MTKHKYLPTTLITDKGTAFTSRFVAEIAQILGIQMKCATTKSPEDAMQIDLLPNLPASGGYENIKTAMDVFSRYLFAYTVTDASATNTAKVIIDI